MHNSNITIYLSGNKIKHDIYSIFSRLIIIYFITHRISFDLIIDNGLSWSRSYGCWIYNCPCNQFVSDLRKGHSCFSGTPVSSTNKTDRHDITEIFLKVALYTITLTLNNRQRYMINLTDLC